MLASWNTVTHREDVGTLCQCILHMPLNLLDGGCVDHRADHHTVVGAGSNLHLCHAVGQLLGKSIIDARLD